MFTLLVYLAITSFCFFFCEWKIISLWGLCMKAAICCTWANNCVYKTLVLIGASMIELSFRLYPYQIVDFLPFKVFLLCICKKCVWIKIHQTETHFALKFKCELSMKQNCAESEKQYNFKCRLFKFNAFMKTAGTTLWIYSSAYIYLYMNMFK